MAFDRIHEIQALAVRAVLGLDAAELRSAIHRQHLPSQLGRERVQRRLEACLGSSTPLGGPGITRETTLEPVLRLSVGSLTCDLPFRWCGRLRGARWRALDSRAPEEWCARRAPGFHAAEPPTRRDRTIRRPMTCPLISAPEPSGAGATLTKRSARSSPLSSVHRMGRRGPRGPPAAGRIARERARSSLAVSARRRQIVPAQPQRDRLAETTPIQQVQEQRPGSSEALQHV
jgi:hypothetical protein